jgi:hypothetical protein
METTKQLSVFLENKPGRLASLLRALAREKVNVVALTIMDSHEHSVLRLVTNDLSSTRQVLSGLNVSSTEADVLVVDLRNQPGGEQQPPRRGPPAAQAAQRRREGRPVVVNGGVRLATLRRSVLAATLLRSVAKRMGPPLPRVPTAKARSG